MPLERDEQGSRKEWEEPDHTIYMNGYRNVKWKSEYLRSMTPGYLSTWAGREVGSAVLLDR